MTDIYRAMADPTRRAILDELTERDGQTMFQLCTHVITRSGADMSRQGISQHLAVLESAGLVRTRKSGRFKLHYLDTTPLAELVRRWPITREKPCD